MSGEVLASSSPTFYVESDAQLRIIFSFPIYCSLSKY